MLGAGNIRRISLAKENLHKNPRLLTLPAILVPRNKSPKEETIEDLKLNSPPELKIKQRSPPLIKIPENSPGKISSKDVINKLNEMLDQTFTQETKEKYFQEILKRKNSGTKSPPNMIALPRSPKGGLKQTSKWNMFQRKSSSPSEKSPAKGSDKSPDSGSSDSNSSSSSGSSKKNAKNPASVLRRMRTAKSELKEEEKQESENEDQGEKNEKFQRNLFKKTSRVLQFMAKVTANSAKSKEKKKKAEMHRIKVAKEIKNKLSTYHKKFQLAKVVLDNLEYFFNFDIPYCDYLYAPIPSIMNKVPLNDLSGVNNDDRDRFMEYLQEFVEYMQKVSLYLELATVNYQNKEMVCDYLDQGIAQSKLSKELEVYLAVNLLKAKTLILFYEVMEALQVLKMIKKISLQYRKDEIFLKALKNEGKCYQKMGKFNKAYFYYVKMLHFSWALDNENYELKSYDLLGMTYYYKRNMEKAVFYHNRMSKGHIEPKDSPMRQLAERRMKIKLEKMTKRQHDQTHFISHIPYKTNLLLTESIQYDLLQEQTSKRAEGELILSGSMSSKGSGSSEGEGELLERNKAKKAGEKSDAQKIEEYLKENKFKKAEKLIVRTKMKVYSVRNKTDDVFKNFTHLQSDLNIVFTPEGQAYFSANQKDLNINKSKEYNDLGIPVQDFEEDALTIKQELEEKKKKKRQFKIKRHILPPNSTGYFTHMSLNRNENHSPQKGDAGQPAENTTLNLRGGELLIKNLRKLKDNIDHITNEIQEVVKRNDNSVFKRGAKSGSPRRRVIFAQTKVSHHL